MKYSLVPRPHPAFRRLKYGKAVETFHSRAGRAWEQGYRWNESRQNEPKSHLYVPCRSVWSKLNQVIRALFRRIKVTSELLKSSNQECVSAIWPLTLRKSSNQAHFLLIKNLDTSRKHFNRWHICDHHLILSSTNVQTSSSWLDRQGLWDCTLTSLLQWRIQGI